MVENRQYGVDGIKKFVFEELLPLVAPRVIFALRGPLGVGKTTIVRELLDQLRVTKLVVSPTFSYINEYRIANDFTVLHFDLYRISSDEEFSSMGFAELIGGDEYCSIVEWPEVIDSVLVELCETHVVYLVELKYMNKDLGFRQIRVVPYR